MKKRITAKQAAFLLPLFLLLAVFAIYPIITSVVYSLFDYRTNDQTAAGLYTGSNFNAPLFYEDCDYSVWYLEDEVTVLPEEDASELQGIMDEITAVAEPYKEAKEVVSMSNKDAQAMQAKMDDIRTRLVAIFERNPDAEFVNGLETQTTLFDEIDGCFINSNFTGLAAYKKLLSDSRFGDSLGSTFLFTVVSVFFELCLGMGLALIMNKAIKGIGLSLIHI